MFNNISQCPHCGEHIPVERHFAGFTACACGWTFSQKQEHFEKQQILRTITQLVGFTAFLLGFLAHVTTWNEFSLQVLPLQFKELAGLMKAQDLEAFSQICQARKNLQCMERSYTQLAQLQPHNQEIFSKLARIQKEYDQMDSALENFANYFSRGGEASSVAYEYAEALALSHMAKEALQFFEYAINKDPYHVDAKRVRTYVLMLIEQNEWVKARNVIHQIRRHNSKATYFMNQELNYIMTKLTVATL